jgi:hypothetical protein
VGRLKKTHTVAFRVDEDEYRRVDAAAGAEGLGANEWCRGLVLARVGGAQALGPGERLLYEEVACLRYLLAHGLKLLAAGRLSPGAWEETIALADRNAARIAEVLLARRGAAADKSD